MTLRDSLHSTLIGASLVGLSGCGMFGGPLDGTWVFQWDRGTYQAADSCEELSDGGYPIHTESGDDYSFVEIYATKGTGIVVVHEGEEFIGEADGKTFEVEAKYSSIREYSSDSFSQYEWLWELNGEFASGELSGQEDYKRIIGDEDEECLYQHRRKYTAVKLKTQNKPERSAGEGGSGGPGGGGSADTGW